MAYSSIENLIYHNLVPHLAAVSDDVGHAGVDDHVGGHVQVSDALINEMIFFFCGQR